MSIGRVLEHYLVRIMRDHPDFLRELAFVLELDGHIIGNIMYTRATLTGQDGGQKHIVTFGPVSIAPAYQRQGYGAKLIRHSLLQAKALGYEAVVIIARPANYVGLGFKSSKNTTYAPRTGAILPPCWSVSLRPRRWAGKPGYTATAP